MNPKFIRSHQDLITTAESTRQGFLEQALKKTEVAEAFADSVNRLRESLKTAANPEEASAITSIREELIAAAGFSDKASNYFSASELGQALKTVLERIYEESEGAAIDWRDNVVYRFLLTKGDSAGGMMRNITGAAATSKFAQEVLRILQERNVTHQSLYSPSNPNKIQQISWEERVLYFDKTPKFIGKNIDVTLLRNRSGTLAERLNRKEDFIACGELKGGIDPAGADEHWKTAATALQRIREGFSSNTPALFFVGSAIEAAMAEEIFSQLTSDELTFAANFNAPDQLTDLVTWLTSL